DQYTSFAKDPWLHDRPENRKQCSTLSKATFAEWPNTTSNFSLHRGVVPAGKLTSHHKSRFANQYEGVGAGPSPSQMASKAIATRTPCRAISDAQLRATISTNNGHRSAQSGGANTITNDKMRCSAATHTTSEARHSADNVTA
ncbi:unnamed protein product, partial [Ectocarpus sp. 4 AP-2014]